MAGKICIGDPMNNAGAGRLAQSKAFCEGIHYRAGGTALERPAANNPHPIGQIDRTNWNRGWTFANNASPSAVDPDLAPCCAASGLVPA